MCKNTNKLRAEKNAINLKTQKEYNLLNTQNKKMKKRNLENARAGITLIALVITIIVNRVFYDKNKNISNLVGSPMIYINL